MTTLKSNNVKTTKLNNVKPVKVEYSLTWKELLLLNSLYKEQSLFRIIDFLNQQIPTLCNEHNIPIITVTIDILKNLCPDYFIISITDNKTKETTLGPRKKFLPFVFLKAIRAEYFKLS
jgi:hypothetical protein